MRRFAILISAFVLALLAGASWAPAMHSAAYAARVAGKPPHRSRSRSCRRHTRSHQRASCRRRPTRKTTLASPAATGGLIVGLNAGAAGWGGASTAPYLDQVVSQSGTRWLREQFDWATLEPRPGVFDFSYYDHFMLLAAQRGLHILPLLYGTPGWAGPSASAIPADPSAYAAYAAAVVNRWGPHGSFWARYPSLSSSAIREIEIWNEPYLTSGDNGSYDPARYARLVKAAGIAARAADPEVKVLLEAEMQSTREANGNWQWWVDGLYQAVHDLNSYFDGVAMHDYGNDTTTLTPMHPGQPYENYGHMLRIHDLRQQFVNHGASDKPFWITEVGWSTCTQEAGCVSQSQQAANLTTLLDDVHSTWSDWIQGVFVYRYQDGADPATVQDAYGMTNRDGSPKPALSEFRAAALASAG